MEESEVRKYQKTDHITSLWSLACTFPDSLVPVLFCSSFALLCKALPFFRIQDGFTLRICQNFAERDAETIHHRGS